MIYLACLANSEERLWVDTSGPTRSYLVNLRFQRENHATYSAPRHSKLVAPLWQPMALAGALRSESWQMGNGRRPTCKKVLGSIQRSGVGIRLMRNRITRAYKSRRS